METTVKYPPIGDKRRRYIQNSIKVKRRILPRSVNVPKFLTSKDILDDSFKIIPASVQKDKTLNLVNFILGIILSLILSPLVVMYAIGIGLSWLFSHARFYSYPTTKEERQLMALDKYLHQCKHHRR